MTEDKKLTINPFRSTEEVKQYDEATVRQVIREIFRDLETVILNERAARLALEEQLHNHDK